MAAAMISYRMARSSWAVNGLSKCASAEDECGIKAASRGYVLPIFPMSSPQSRFPGRVSA